MINYAELIKALKLISSTLSGVNAEEIVQQKKFSSVEKELQDLLHEAELSHLSRKEKLTLANSISDKRQERRRIKNALELLNIQTKFVNDNSKLVNLLNTLAKKLQDTIDLQNSRTYSPRVENTQLKIAKKIHKKY